MTTLCIIAGTITFQTANSLLSFYDRDAPAYRSQPRRIPILGSRWDGPGGALHLQQCDDLAEKPQEMEEQESKEIQKYQTVC